MLQKTFFKQQDRVQLSIAFIGALLGLTFLITSIHYLIKVNEFGRGNEILGPNTLIIQKKIGANNAFQLGKNDFTKREIELIKAESFVAAVEPIISNNFDVSLQTNSTVVPYFRTDVFLQTVNPTFIDVPAQKWTWKKGDAYVPLIMPRDFLVMLNTFMSAKNIPTVSDEIAQSIPFEFTLKHGDRKEKMNVRIIGFTNEISSLLVPESFMKWANEQYGQTTDQKITQLMLAGKENQFGLVEGMLKEKHLESKNAQVLVGRLKSMIGTFIWIVLCVSILAVFLSGLVLIQYLQLLINKNNYEIKTLIRLGYHPKTLVITFVRYFFNVFGSITVLSIVLFNIVKFYLDAAFNKGGVYIESSFTFASYLAIVIAYVIFTLVSFISAKKHIYNAEKG
ncbi:MAG: hypothetical protein RLZZ493_926 [Bacteroidota bacterium]|jgi:hypothetical protein